MPVTPNDFYDFARGIIQFYPQEIGLRNSVSRIYYSVYLEARERLDVRDRRQAHSAVEAAIRKGTRGKSADEFKELRELRDQADYELRHNDWEPKQKRAFRLADRILGELRKRMGQ